jgi:hypothetical protein
MSTAIYMVACPVHRRYVGTDANHRILGRCSGCMAEAAEAQRIIEHGELATQLLLAVQGAS